jgi:HlyD family secretion protein
MKNVILPALATIFLASCGGRKSHHVQGYVEGEYVYIASARAGTVTTMSVSRGSEVASGAPLFALEAGLETAELSQAQRRLSEAVANLEDTRKSKRPEEIASVEAQLQQARASLDYTEAEFARQSELIKSRAIAARDLDNARALRDRDKERVSQYEAELSVAKLGSRSDQIAAAEAAVHAQEASVAAAEWSLGQKTQTSPQAGLIFDTLYELGEWVGAGQPVIVLLPPGNIKVRAYVPEPHLASLKLGGEARVLRDGAEPVTGKIVFISPSAEFTPPVIYSRETRSKLVYLVEITFDPAIAASLHPGQPVDIEL